MIALKIDAPLPWAANILLVFFMSSIWRLLSEWTVNAEVETAQFSFKIPASRPLLIAVPASRANRLPKRLSTENNPLVTHIFLGRTLFSSPFPFPINPTGGFRFSHRLSPSFARPLQMLKLITRIFAVAGDASVSDLSPRGRAMTSSRDDRRKHPGQDSNLRPTD